MVVHEYAHAHGNEDEDEDEDEDAHGYEHAHAHGYEHAHAHGYEHAHAHGYEHAHAHGYEDGSESYSNGYPNRPERTGSRFSTRVNGRRTCRARGPSARLRREWRGTRPC
jgi:hypothetical protein